MIRLGDMDDAGAAQARHVATDAIIGPALTRPAAHRQAATSIGVAFQAAIAEVGYLRLGLREPMGIVAGDAPESALARFEATALVHLLELADETVFGRARWLLQHGPEAMEWQTRPKVLIPAAGPQDTPLAVQVALLADGVPERGLQRGGIHDRQVPAVDRLGTQDVELARPVTPLAADGVALEDRRLITVGRASDGSVRLAWQNRQADMIGRSKWCVYLLIAGRQIPPSPRAYQAIGDWEQEAVSLDQIGNPEPPGTEREADFPLILGDDPSPMRPAASL